ncbi:MAG: amino acid permease [Myxococcales bacterium]|nr:amino acid permease [Myxococcales bacterium]
MSKEQAEKMGFNATWSMAVGGMVGGGIFSVIGVVISTSGRWAWLSFVIAGLVALLTGYSYIALAKRFGEGGGAFTFLRHENMPNFAGSLSWVLILGYVLTISVYAFTFGHYLSHVMGLGEVASRIAAISIVAVLVAVNLRGVGDASWVEIVTVWGKLAVLLGLGIIGIVHFSPDQIAYDDAKPGGLIGALVGAASVFMAYEGFQLLTYDYEDIEDPNKTLPRAVLSAIIVVIGIYVLVSLATASLVGAGTIVEHEEVALAIAGRNALGTAGEVIVTIAAAFSTASAINATLFATARLTRRVAEDGELPKMFSQTTDAGVPTFAIIVLGVGGASLAVLGSLSDLVEAASLTFLFTFTTVNLLAVHKSEGWKRAIHIAGSALAAAATITLIYRIATHEAYVLAVLLGVGVVAAVVPRLLSSDEDSD